MKRVVLLLAVAACDWSGAFDTYCARSSQCDAGAAGGGANAGGAGGGATGGGATGGGATGGGTACVSTCDGGCGVDTCGRLCPIVADSCDASPCFGKLPAGGGDLVNAYGTTADDFWVASERDFAFHHDSTGWQCLPTSAIGANHGIWASGRELWVAGDDGGVLHYVPGTQPVIEQATSGPVAGVWSEGDGGVWAVSAAHVVRRKSDNTWELRVQTGFGPTAGGVHGGGGIVVVVGDGGFVGRADNIEWQVMSISPEALKTVYVDPKATAWTVEGTGAMSRRILISTSRGLMWTLDGFVGSDGDIASSMTGADGVVYLSVNRVGAGGALMRRDPLLSWQTASTYEPSPLGIWAAPGGDVIVARRGSSEVLRYRPPVCPYPTAPLMDTFTEKPSAGWAQRSGLGEAQVIGDRLRVPEPGVMGFTGLTLTAPIDVADRSVSVRIDTPAGPPLETWFSLGATDEVAIFLKGGAVYTWDGAARGPHADVPMSGYFRIRNQGAAVFFESDERDGGWKTFDTLPDAGSVVRPAARLSLAVRRVGMSLGGSAAVFDNLNACPQP